MLALVLVRMLRMGHGVVAPQVPRLARAQSPEGAQDSAPDLAQMHVMPQAPLAQRCAGLRLALALAGQQAAAPLRALMGGASPGGRLPHGE